MDVDHKHPSPKPKWSADLYGCSDNGICICYLTFCLPCVTFGRIAHIVDEGKSSCVAKGCIYGVLMLCSWHWILSCLYREKLRAKYDLPEDPCNDFCVHCCCESCALCQEYAELKHRGFDPCKGWVGPPNVPPSPEKPMSK